MIAVLLIAAAGPSSPPGWPQPMPGPPQIWVAPAVPKPGPGQEAEGPIRDGWSAIVDAIGNFREWVAKLLDAIGGRISDRIERIAGKVEAAEQRAAAAWDRLLFWMRVGFWLLVVSVVARLLEPVGKLYSAFRGK